MAMLSYDDPVKLQTKKIVFEDIFQARDSASLEQLKELSSKRKAIAESINKSSSVTEAIAREISGGLTTQCAQDLQKLEQYLPLLENLTYQVDLADSVLKHFIPTWISKLKIRWSSGLSSLSAFSLSGPKFFHIGELQFERSMTLFLYGAMLRIRASEVSSVDKLQATTLFRRAAGVYDYLANEVCTSFKNVSAHERPPETSSYVCAAMSLICLAESQVVSIKKAEELQTSVGTLAKLHCGVADLFHQASLSLTSAAKECKEFSSRLSDFVSTSKALNELKSYNFFAKFLNGDDKMGSAIGVLRQAKSIALKKIPERDSWRLMFKKEIDDVASLIKKYEHENDLVSCDKVPANDELPRPDCKIIVMHIAYEPQRWERKIVFKI